MSKWYFSLGLFFCLSGLGVIILSLSLDPKSRILLLEGAGLSCIFGTILLFVDLKTNTEYHPEPLGKIAILCGVVLCMIGIGLPGEFFVFKTILVIGGSLLISFAFSPLPFKFDFW